MCVCTPNIRTPYCGKPGCEWPKPEQEPGVTIRTEAPKTAVQCTGCNRIVWSTDVDANGRCCDCPLPTKKGRA